MSKDFSEDQILEGLQQEDEEVMKFVYANGKNMAFQWILKHGGNESDAHSIYHDSLISLIESIRKGKFRKESKTSTYLIGIVKYKWLNHQRQKGIHFSEWNDQLKNIEYEEEADSKEADFELLEHSLKLISEECQKLLIAFYYEKKKLKQIATTLNYTESFIRVKKTRCLSALKNQIEKAS